MKMSVEKIKNYYIQASVVMTKHMYCRKQQLLAGGISEEGKEDKKDTCKEATSNSILYKDSYRRHYTLNVLGMLDIINMRWIYGSTKRNFDILTQIRFWVHGIDTISNLGCSIGKLAEHDEILDIHWNWGDDITEAILEVGTVVGVKTDSYLQERVDSPNENILLFIEQEDENNQILCVENLTFIPLDKEALDTSYMNHEDIVRINNYQQSVYDAVGPYLTEEERQWLAEECGKIVFS